jgi:hypothetical protein
VEGLVVFVCIYVHTYEYLGRSDLSDGKVRGAPHALRIGVKCRGKYRMCLVLGREGGRTKGERKTSMGPLLSHLPFRMVVKFEKITPPSSLGPALSTPPTSLWVLGVVVAAVAVPSTCVCSPLVPLQF